jgi:hypothetical protein
MPSKGKAKAPSSTLGSAKRKRKRKKGNKGRREGGREGRRKEEVRDILGFSTCISRRHICELNCTGIY